MEDAKATAAGPMKTKVPDRAGAPATAVAASTEPQTSQGHGVEINIWGPLIFWIFFLILGLALELLVAPVVKSAGNVDIANTIGTIAGYIIYMPGSIILPLIVALWIGERVGASHAKLSPAATVGIVNATYAALIYAVTIFIIYLLIRYVAPNFLSTITLESFLIYAVAIPVAIVIVLIPLIASLSAARHSSG